MCGWQVRDSQEQEMRPNPQRMGTDTVGRERLSYKKFILCRPKGGGQAQDCACRVFLPGSSGGAAGNRTPDLDIANVALYQLSYDPNPDSHRSDCGGP